MFRRDGVTVRDWQTALRDACRKARVPPRLLHDCRRTAARNLVRAGVPERVAMLLTRHRTRSVFDRYNIVNERELLTAGETLVTYLHHRARHRSSPSTAGPRTAGARRGTIAAAEGEEPQERPSRRARHMVTREELYALVWSDPLSKVAPQYGLSDRGLSQICLRHQVPLPPFGYWARERAGKRGDRSPLPVGPQTLVLLRGRQGTNRVESASVVPVRPL